MCQIRDRDSVCNLLIKFVQVATLPKIVQKFPIANWISIYKLFMSWPLLGFLISFPAILHLALCALATNCSQFCTLNELPPLSLSFLWAFTCFQLLLFSIWLDPAHLSRPSWTIFSPPRLTQICQLEKFFFLYLPEQTFSLS